MAEKRKIEKVLIVNRGEIAVRILRGVHDLGKKGAVVYSDPDRTGLPVLLADEAYRVGPAPSAESYLRADAIVRLAQEIGADAVHPGYGFLAENAGFARSCAEAGIVFIGPSPEAIATMGSKVESRRLMMDAEVPVVPGGRDTLPDLETAETAAAEIGYPVMLKAAAGGGGKGMRMVPSSAELPAAFRAARSEARASFGDDTVYLEKFVEQPRHVEIQVLGDHHGKVVSLGERECSLQRRHQKVVEEAPSPVVDADLRLRMGEAAVRAAAKAVNYTNAGTVEFLLDGHGREFYFLEMNTRLQVEHPVTETGDRHRPGGGADPTSPSRRAAAGGAGDSRVEPRGHAIEVRLYAEDPFRNFAPSPGRRSNCSNVGRRARASATTAGVYEGSRGHDPLRPDARQADRLGSAIASDALARLRPGARRNCGSRASAPTCPALRATARGRGLRLTGNMDISHAGSKARERRPDGRTGRTSDAAGDRDLPVGGRRPTPT